MLVVVRLNKNFVKLSRPLDVINGHCGITGFDIHNYCIRYVGTGDYGEKLKIHGVAIRHNQYRVTEKTLVAFSAMDDNEPVSIAPVSSFQHSGVLAECLTNLL